MTSKSWRSALLAAALSFGAVVSVITTSPSVFAQETTGGLQGTIKDATGAVVPGATVTVTTPSLPGGKSATTDSKGYYHFSNLPPGAYLIAVEAKGFSELKREGLVLEVGHDPTIDLALAVGAENAIVEVSSESPQIDVTSVTTQTNITQDVVNYVPHGTSFQSVIQFAPDASNEPLMGNTQTAGTGGTSPGNGSNGSAYGYSIGGGSDSENAYLVEGQETANLIGGYSHTETPFDFIQEVSVKTSGIQAQYGGALGGVINVIMQKGTAHYHGSVFAQYESTGLDANPYNAFSRYDPSSQPTNTSWGAVDQPYQSYQPIKPKTQIIYPGFRLGGPLLPFSSRFRDKIFFFAGFNPEMQRYEEFLNYGPASAASPGNIPGKVPFSQNTNTYYTTARIDAQVTQKIRVFGSWLYQLQRQNGEALPQADSKQGFYNIDTTCYASASTPCSGGATTQAAFAHTLGYVAPNITVNTGADITITPSLVSTTRFGYYFENYHDFGYSTTGNSYYFETSGSNATPGANENAGFQNDAYNQNYTTQDASKAIQLDQGFAWFKSTSFGTHNFNFGYQLNRLSNVITQRYNNPYVAVYAGGDYTAETSVGAANCQTPGLLTNPSNTSPNCFGSDGYVDVSDFGTNGKATSYNNGIYGQDSWTIGRGITIDAGIRDEKEFLPGEAQPGPDVPTHPINFGWKDKIAPRLGASWDVFHDGKFKLFGSYGKFYDVMKLNLAISSFGGQYWQNCFYALSTSYTAVNPVYNSNNRDCVGNSDASTATFSGLPAGQSPAGTNFIENINYRAFPTTCSTCSATEEGVAPSLKPYQQHESVFGTDYQVSRNVAFEARYDRRRLDRAIEDSAIYNPAVGETFVVVNPGYGSDNTFSSFCNFLYGAGAAGCASTTGTYPPNQTIPAARSYDGLELRVNKAISNHWSGMLSYTYSHFRGNYTGLTSSDLSDGGFGGRNSPNNSRAFDEPYFSWNSMGGSSSGLLPTDRPNKLKGYGYYEFKYLHKLTTDLGMFSYIYQGSPNTSYIQDVGDVAGGDYPVQVFNRGVWADVTQNAATGQITIGQPRTYRNPVYAQSDFNFTQAYQISESKSFSFQATFTNVFNEHAVTAVNEQIDSDSPYINNTQQSSVGGYTLGSGVPFYAAAMSGYNVTNMLMSGGVNGGPQTINSGYGKPMYWQQARQIRLQVHFNF
jgi:Carboxypeptidase regulatory-like domain